MTNPPSQQATPIWLLNAPIITVDGRFHCRTISLDEARRLVHEQGFESAIGHAPTAALLSELLAIDCPVNRVDFRQAPQQRALVFRLARRLEEGRILRDRDEIEQIGYAFMLMTREA